MNENCHNLSEIRLEHIKSLACKIFENAKGSHDWDHTLRVYRLCERIGKVEIADMEVVKIAAYLHDIGRSVQDQSAGKVCHAEEGARLTREIIGQLPLSDFQKNNIVHCVRSHRFRGNHKPRTLEAKVLFDADKLDSIGAIGIARAFLFAGEVGAKLHSPDMNLENTLPYSKDDTGYREFKLKLSRVRDRIITTEGRKLAKERHEFMENFFKRFLEEFEGKR
jgi:uncharacterized protein